MPGSFLYAIFFFLLSLRTVGLAQSSVPQESARPKQAAKVFREDLPEVKKETGVSIFLPSELPPWIKEADINCVSAQGEKKGYEFSLYYGECPGMGASFVGWFSAKVGEVSRHGEVVQLANGLTGYFHAKSCGGSCAPTQIEWEQDGVVYTMQLTLGVKTEDEEKEAITNIANSAILAGPR